MQESWDHQFRQVVSALFEEGLSVQRLKQLLFGATTETTRKVIEKLLDEAGKPSPSDGDTEETKAPQTQPKSAAMIALLKYGSGMPFNRLERLEGSLGIPLPAATQWQIVGEMDRTIKPVGDAITLFPLYWLQSITMNGVNPRSLSRLTRVVYPTIQWISTLIRSSWRSFDADSDRTGE